MLLGFWEKTYILAAAGFLIILTIIVVSCFVGPGCWGFEYLRKREERKKIENQILGIVSLPIEKTSSSHVCESNWNTWIDNRDYVIYQTENSKMEKKSPFKFNGKKSLCNQKENFFNVKRISLLDKNSISNEKNYSKPKLKLKILYTILKNNSAMGRLEIQVNSVSCLPFRDYIPVLDSFVLVSVSLKKWPFQREEQEICTVQTRTIKNNLNPEFDQIFTFDAVIREIKNWNVKFTIMDNDRLTKISPLFEKKITVKDVLSLTDNNSTTLILVMEKVFVHIGTLYFGVRYLPTAQKLTVNIVKGKKLRYRNHVNTLSEFFPYIRVVLLNSYGKCLKKKKTNYKQGEFNPIFNQSFTFDLTYCSVEETMILILLCTKITKNHGTSDDNSEENDIEKSLKENKDKVLGSVVLGRNVNHTTARNHWVAVMQNPRKMISVWHELR